MKGFHINNISRVKKFLITILFVVTIAGCQPEKNDVAVDESGNIVNEIKSLEKKASGGDIEAMLKLGELFLNGEGIEINYAEAIKWLEMASVKGSARAKSYWGIILVSGGHGVEKDEKLGVDLMIQAAEQNDGMAQYILAQYYLGTKQTERGLIFMEKAAEGGMLQAQMALGDYYGSNTDGRNLDKAVKWYRRASGQNYAPAMNNLAYILAMQGVSLDEALALAGKAIETDSDNGAYLDTIGWVFFKKERYAEALARLLQAEKLLPDDYEVQNHLGETYLKLNQKEKAIAVWDRALSTVEDPEMEKQIRQKLFSLKQSATGKQSGL
jgi:TPR repeat protein